MYTPMGLRVHTSSTPTSRNPKCNEPNANHHSKGARASLKVPRVLTSARWIPPFVPFPSLLWRPINKAFAVSSTCSLCFCTCCGRFLVFPPPPSPRFLHCEIKLTLELHVPFFSWQRRERIGIASLTRGMAGGERWTSVWAEGLGGLPLNKLRDY